MQSFFQDGGQRQIFQRDPTPNIKKNNNINTVNRVKSDMNSESEKLRRLTFILDSNSNFNENLHIHIQIPTPVKSGIILEPIQIPESESTTTTSYPQWINIFKPLLIKV